MRLSARIAVTIVVAAGPANAQAWMDYAYRDVGFAVQFPAEPSVEQTTYSFASGQSAPATVYSAHSGNSIYSVTVADLSNTPGDKPMRSTMP